MADTLEIFGVEYPNATGIKATDDGGTVRTFIRPVGTKNITSNGTSDVTAYATVSVAVPSGSPNLQTVTKSYTPTESAITEAVTADSGYDGIDTVNVTVGAISSTYVGTGVTRRSSSDLEVWDDMVVVPAGYYEQEAEAGVSLTTIATPTATKSSVSNHSVTVTPSVTQTAGYVSRGTKTGTAVTVTASELVSGTKSITTNGTEDVTNYASVTVAVPYVTCYTGTSTPSSSLGSNGDIYVKVVS